MQIKKITTNPFNDQKPGTSGLRKKAKLLTDTPNYLENYIQAIFNVADVKGKTYVLGGDGRYFNRQAIQTIIKMAIASEVGHLIIGQNGFFSTPAVSCVVRKLKTDGAIILTASHNPAGPNGDFGIKFDIENGGPAPERIMQEIYEESKKITSYDIADMMDYDISVLGENKVEQTTITIINPITDYVEMVKELFDFDAIRSLFQKGFRMTYDAMNAVTGPYAKEIFENQLGAPVGTVVNGVPKEDFGGLHADPNLTYAKALVDVMYGENAPDMGAASDGDGDRNMILGPSFFVNPSESVAILASYWDKVKGYKGGLSGLSRSMPTSQSMDRVAEDLGIPLYQTPTGWKYFGSLLDAGKISICGEESFGAGSYHIREKDGLWSILYWLNILAVTGLSIPEVVKKHWEKYGRFYCLRYDFDTVPKEQGDAVMDGLISRLNSLVGKEFSCGKVIKAEEFSYTDPVSLEVASHEGIQIVLEGGHRMIYRLSGTGTQGATIRVYVERAETKELDMEVVDATRELIKTACEVAEIEKITGRTEPSVIT